MVTDTVGFIRELPPQLIEAFKATLEESAEADVLIHAIDLSSPNMQTQMEVVEKLIEEFEWQDKKRIFVFNKVDLAPLERQFQVSQYPRVFVSALTGQGIEQLKRLMVEAVGELHTSVQLYFPRGEEHKIFELGRETKVVRKEVATEGTVCYAHLTPQLISRWKDYLVK